MKPSCFPPLRVLLIPCLATVLLILAASPGLATPEDNIDSGLAEARTWTSMIDNGRYEQSYNISSDSLRSKLPEDKWIVLLKTFRDSWGPVVNRKEANHIFRPNGFEGAEGQFLVITYNTSFKNVGELMEVVVLRWDNGQWKGAGYNGGPLPAAPGSDQDASSAPAQADTQTTTAPLTK